MRLQENRSSPLKEEPKTKAQKLVPDQPGIFVTDKKKQPSPEKRIFIGDKNKRTPSITGPVSGANNTNSSFVDPNRIINTMPRNASTIRNADIVDADKYKSYKDKLYT
jgi:hypothetical protein